MGLVDLFFPKNCVECGKIGAYLCPACINSVDYANTICPSCGRFSFFGVTHPQCLGEYSLNGLVVVWNYEKAIKRAINVLKYKFAAEMADEMGEAAAIEIKKFKLPPKYVFIPVPLHRTRGNWRGFNQAEKLADAMAHRLNKEVYSTLVYKIQGSPQQTGLDQKKRLRNISGKFAVNTALLSQIDKKTALVIVDDVWTTGSTLKEVGKVLKMAGARSVYGFALARRA